MVVFDPDDLDVAVEELDGRYMACEGAPYRDRLVYGRSVLDAMNRQDWELYRSQLAPDFVFLDHRPASVGEVGLEEYLRFVQSINDVETDVRRWVAEYVANRSDRGLVLLHGRAKTLDGADIEYAAYVLDVMRDGLVTRLEFFPEDQRDAALARLAELTADSTDG